MDIVTTVPVPVKAPDTIAPLLEAVRDRVACRAFENYVRRGCVDGHDVDDWLDAERELIIKPIPIIRADRDDIFVKMVLPVETNIIIFELNHTITASTLVEKLKENDILGYAISPNRVRLVVHLDITEEMVARTIETIDKI